MELFLISIAVIGVLLVITTVSDKRKNPDKYPTKEVRQKVEQGKHYFRAGAINMAPAANNKYSLSGDAVRARDQWERAAALGNVQAITGIGIVAMRDNDLAAAQTRWTEAFNKGDFAAYIFRRITADPESSKQYPSAVSEYLSAMASGEPYGLRRWSATARQLGFSTYADEVVERATVIEYSDRLGKGPWGTTL